MTDITGHTPKGKTSAIAEALAAASQAGLAVVIDDGPLDLSGLRQWPNVQLDQKKNFGV